MSLFGSPNHLFSLQGESVDTHIPRCPCSANLKKNSLQGESAEGRNERLPHHLQQQGEGGGEQSILTIDFVIVIVIVTVNLIVFAIAIAIVIAIGIVIVVVRVMQGS